MTWMKYYFNLLNKYAREYIITHLRLLCKLQKIIECYEMHSRVVFNLYFVFDYFYSFSKAFCFKENFYAAHIV